MQQPYKNIFILLVGRSQYAQSIKSFKDMSVCLAKSLSQQCKVHASQKLNKTFRLYSCYTRMWGEEMTVKMISGIQRSLIMSGKAFLLSAVCLAPYKWKEKKISDQNLERFVSEYESVEELCSSTVRCEECHKRQVIDKKINSIDYCMCKGKLGYTNRNRCYESWEPFLERENILVWRRKDEKHGHLYSYKVFGTYDDMSLCAFMEVQLNSAYRSQWDTTALELKVLDSDPETNSDLLYWVVKFPYFFANRDYLFKRRYRVNEEKKEVVILNEIAEHSQVSEEQGLHRVKDYWSIMVLKANESFNMPGMSYTLTYFDNPGTSLPATVTNFIASTAFPDFLIKVHSAALNLQRRWERGEDVYVTLPPKLRIPTTTKESADVLLGIKSDSIPSEIFRKSEKTLSKYSIEKDQISYTDTNDIEENRKQKVSLRFKKVVIDLLEAIEVISPEYNEKSILTSKIELLVDKLGFKNSKRQKLINKLETLSSKTKIFMKEAAKKKEESLKIMNDIERKHYYDQTSHDEPAILLFQGLLQAINEILKADKDMRTGKDLAKALAKNSQNDVQSEQQIDPDSTNNANSTQKSKVEFCHCCNREQGLSEEDRHWYDYFTSMIGLKTKSTELTERYNSQRESCVCSHKIEKQNGSPSIKKEFERVEKMQADESSWLYFITSFRTSHDHLISTENNESTEEKTENNYQDDDDKTVPWYFLQWIGKYLFGASV